MTGDLATPKGSECWASEPGGVRGTQCTPVPSSTQEEEDLALAQALSASEAEYQQSQRQVSEAGCRLCTAVGLIPVWLHHGGVFPGFCFLWALSRVTFLTRRAAWPGAMAASLLSTHPWGLEHWMCPLVGQRKKPIFPCSVCLFSFQAHSSKPSNCSMS